jgi:hypothetical protein
MIDTLSPGLALFGLVTNMFVVLTLFGAYKKSRTLTQKEIDQLKQPFFVFMLKNAVLNMAFCAVYFF